MLIGHEKTIKDLKRMAEAHALPHGMLFFGSESVGKRTVAQALAEFLETGDFVCPDRSVGNFEEGLIEKKKGKKGAKISAKAEASPEPSRRILNDCLVIGPGEAQSIGIDAVREVKNFLWQRPNVSPYRVLIIDQAELLTEEAQNALLKITEEPPESGVLILVAKDPELLAPTLVSRLQKMHFGNVSEPKIQKWLIERGIAPKDVETFAKASFGRPGYAWRLATDDDLNELRETMATLFSATSDSRKALVKKIIEPDDFNFGKFLDAAIIHWTEVYFPKREKLELWHKLLDLRTNVEHFNLNPRLQIENLFYNQ